MSIREADWWSLRNTYNKNGIVLALGAGVPKRAGTPDWVKLLMRIEDKCRDPGGRCLVKWLQRDGYSLPYIAAALQEICKVKDKDQDFAEIVREALYRDFPYYYRNLGKEFEESDQVAFVKWIEENNCTLCAVAALCAVLNEQTQSYDHNPHIHAIVDFNVDSILREFVHAKYGKPDKTLLRTVERASKNPRLNRIRLYKMHGLLRFEGELKQGPRKEAADKLVFTEGEYFDRFNSPTSLFNYTFLSLLREHSFLFIGLSMQDDNIRRLLHYSTLERKQALVEERNQDIEERRKRAKDQHREPTGKDPVPYDIDHPYIVKAAIRHFAIIRRETTGGVDNVRETTLKKLGVRVLWVDNHNQTLPRLKQMYETTDGRHWDDVYGCKSKSGNGPANVAEAMNATRKSRSAEPAKPDFAR